MLKPKITSAFKTDYKKAALSGKHNMALVQSIMVKIQQEIPLEEKYHDHSLKGDWSDCRECHIKADFLLVYRIDKLNKTIVYVRLGSHSELFG